MGSGWRRGMHLGFCAGDPGSIPARVSGWASQLPTYMVRLAVSWNRVRVPAPWSWLDMVRNPQPTNHKQHTERTNRTENASRGGSERWLRVSPRLVEICFELENGEKLLYGDEGKVIELCVRSKIRKKLVFVVLELAAIGDAGTPIY